MSVSDIYSSFAGIDENAVLLYNLRKNNKKGEST